MLGAFGSFEIAIFLDGIVFLYPLLSVTLSETLYIPASW